MGKFLRNRVQTNNKRDSWYLSSREDKCSELINFYFSILSPIDYGERIELKGEFYKIFSKDGENTISHFIMQDGFPVFYICLNLFEGQKLYISPVIKKKN